MSKPGQDHTVIVVRRHKAHQAHHGGAWKVAYADFVTAMMAFFLVMWLAAQDSRIRQAVAGYFQDPGLLPNERSNSILASGRGGIDSDGLTVLSRRPEGMLEAEQRALVGAAEHIRQKLLNTPEFASLRDQVEVTITAEGLRIELVDKSGSSFFDNGSSVLRGESERILTTIAQEIGKLENDVVIEGHTDSRQYAGGERFGNWELSADRANAARRVMVTSGLRKGQLRAVRGYADTELRIANDPLDPRNRRVSIVVRSQVAAALEAAVREGKIPR
ncbi:MAG TPA: flagellar motor protein MotB [Vicinamibacterales bacterium]|jgi:chemotaxis protein MotB|nr:flagellar motor protein MotB [Vicinamibacterales bacterium]